MIYDIIDVVYNCGHHRKKLGQEYQSEACESECFFKTSAIMDTNLLVHFYQKTILH